MTQSARIRLAFCLAAATLLLASACQGRSSGSNSIDLMTLVDGADLRPSSDAVLTTTATLNGVSRRVLAVTGVARVTWTLRIPACASLRTWVGVVPGPVAPAAAALFRVGVADDRVYEELLTRRVNPFEQPGDRLWIPLDVDLGSYGGFQWSLFYRPGRQTWKVILNTTTSGQGTAVWAEPTIQTAGSDTCYIRARFSDTVPSPPPLDRSIGSWIRTWMLRLLLVAATILATIVIGGGLDARRRHPELKPWHRLVPSAEMTASDITDTVTLPEYLRHEAAVFDQVRREVELRLSEPDRILTNRYNPEGVSSPSRLPHDYNRTLELTPDEVRGGALLVHGLTDSPYSMRALAECLQGAGYYSLSLRMPGHGGVPGGLTKATWQDWMAAVRLGARHVRGRIGPSKPLVLVGYSNGGALVVKYALDELDGRTDSKVDRLVLVSPMIGVTPFARLSSVISALSPIPYFDRAAWLDVLPEFNPFKFNSFPANAARQTYDLTQAIAEALNRHRAGGGFDRFPPVLTFQSLVDATVSTDAVVNTLYAALPSNGSELVLVDLNRSAHLDPFIRPSDRALLGTLFDRRASRAYTVTVLSNVSSSTAEVAEWRVTAGTTTPVTRPLGLAWPGDVFSLSHIGMPFRADDPIFGIAAPQTADGPIRLGILAPRGERSVLTVPIDTLMRVSYNPFFPYVEQRTREFLR